VLVAREAGRVEGYAHAEVQETPETAYKRAGATLYVHAMAVSARSRGRGVGRALLAALRDAAAARGVAELSLDVYAFNAAARAFYLDAGFARSASASRFARAPMSATGARGAGGPRGGRAGAVALMTEFYGEAGFALPREAARTRSRADRRPRARRVWLLLADGAASATSCSRRLRDGVRRLRGFVTTSSCAWRGTRAGFVDIGRRLLTIPLARRCTSAERRGRARAHRRPRARTGWRAPRGG
jgi:hypothetical protein